MLSVYLTCTCLVENKQNTQGPPGNQDDPTLVRTGTNNTHKDPNNKDMAIGMMNHWYILFIDHGNQDGTINEQPSQVLSLIVVK